MLSRAGPGCRGGKPPATPGSSARGCGCAPHGAQLSTSVQRPGSWQLARVRLPALGGRLELGSHCCCGFLPCAQAGRDTEGSLLRDAPRETRQCGGDGRAWQEETIHLTAHSTQLGLSVSRTASSSSAAREASSPVNADRSCERQRPADPPWRQTHTTLRLFPTQEVAAFCCQPPLAWREWLTTNPVGYHPQVGTPGGSWGPCTLHPPLREAPWEMRDPQGNGR